MTRREMLATLAAGTWLAGRAGAGQTPCRFKTRGVVLYPWDLSLADWPERAAAAGVTTIGLHAAQRLDVLVDFIQSEKGRAFLGACNRLGLEVEYELHAVGELLSRELYYKDTRLFRMDAKEHRNPDANCCPSSPRALEIIAEKAAEYARILKPTTNRYFYWPDDGRDWCQCPHQPTTRHRADPDHVRDDFPPAERPPRTPDIAADGPGAANAL